MRAKLIYASVFRTLGQHVKYRLACQLLIILVNLAALIDCQE